MKHVHSLSAPLFFRALLLTAGLLAAAPGQAALYITIVQGLGGMPGFEQKFSEQTGIIEEASLALNNGQGVKVLSGEEATRASILEHLGSLRDSMTDSDRLALYLIGHGSFDGEEYKFNIPGPDLTTADLVELFDSLPGQNHFLLNTSSTSGALLEALESEGRIIITATRNGNERNATEFGTYFARALNSEDADTNKNQFVSIQEAFDFAAREVDNYYSSADRLATEHPQLRGDNTGSFNLARLSPQPETSDNEALNALLAERRELDAAIEDLQLRRDDMSSEDYTRQLRELVLESARLSDRIDRLNEEAEQSSGN